MLTGKNAQWGSGPCIPTNKQPDVGKTERTVKESRSRDLKGANAGRWLVVLSHRSLRSRLRAARHIKANKKNAIGKKSHNKEMNAGTLVTSKRKLSADAKNWILKKRKN